MTMTNEILEGIVVSVFIAMFLLLLSFVDGIDYFEQMNEIGKDE